MSSVESIDRLFNHPHGAMASIIQEWHRLHSAQRQLQKLLPVPLNQYCHVASFIDGKLLLHVDSNHWSAKLRLMKTDLMQQLRQRSEFLHLKAIEIKVAAKPVNRLEELQQKEGKNFSLSPELAKTLEGMIAYTEDKDFKKSLQKFLGDFKRDSRLRGNDTNKISD